MIAANAMPAMSWTVDCSCNLLRALQTLPKVTSLNCSAGAADASPEDGVQAGHRSAPVSASQLCQSPPGTCNALLSQQTLPKTFIAIAVLPRKLRPSVYTLSRSIPCGQISLLSAWLGDLPSGHAVLTSKWRQRL